MLRFCSNSGKSGSKESEEEKQERGEAREEARGEGAALFRCSNLEKLLSSI